MEDNGSSKLLERRESGFSEEMPSSPIPVAAAADSRRESYDSGLESPPSCSSPQHVFQLELEEPQKQQRKKKKKRLCDSLSVAHFEDVYRLADEVLGEGSHGRVETCVNVFTGKEHAVKIVSKRGWHFSRQKILKEIEMYHLCRGMKEIVQMSEFFEEHDAFYLVFEKAFGGPLVNHIRRRGSFSEEEAARVVADLASALEFLHAKGIAHRDLKPENVLCCGANGFLPIKLCDFDLCSAVYQTVTTPRLRSPVGSVEFMAPEIVEIFACDLDFWEDDEDEDEDDREMTYDKRCDLWSLGVIAYQMLCGFMPFRGWCGKDCGWNDRGQECFACQQSLFRSIRSGKFDFSGERWSGVSREAKDLISRLLTLDPSRRIDASSVLAHPWIAARDADDVQPVVSSAIDIATTATTAQKQKMLSCENVMTKRIKRRPPRVVFAHDDDVDDFGGNRWEF